MQEIMLFLQHHWVLSYTFIIVVVLVTIVEFIKQKRSALQVTPAKLTQMINHDDAVVIDIRSTTLFTDGHIIGALSIPLAELTDKNKKLEKLKARPIVIACMQGIESPRAAELLTKQGFLNVHVLAGGVRAWREANMPIVKG